MHRHEQHRAHDQHSNGGDSIVAVHAREVAECTCSSCDTHLIMNFLHLRRMLCLNVLLDKLGCFEQLRKQTNKEKRKTMSGCPQAQQMSARTGLLLACLRSLTLRHRLHLCTEASPSLSWIACA
jgi:hypothetical protein